MAGSLCEELSPTGEKKKKKKHAPRNSHIDPVIAK